MVYVCSKDNNACHVTYRESSPVLSPLGRLFISSMLTGVGWGLNRQGDLFN